METHKESMVTLQYGTVDEVHDKDYLVKVKIPVLDDLVTDWLPVLARSSYGNKTYDLLDEGTQVAVLLDPTGTDGVVLGALYSEPDPPPVETRDKWHKTFKDGTTLEYDRDAHKLTVDTKGEIDIDATGKISIQAQGDITIESVTGQLKIKSLLPLTVESEMQTTVKAPITTIDAPLTIMTGNLKLMGAILPP